MASSTRTSGRRKTSHWSALSHSSPFILLTLPRHQSWETFYTNADDVYRGFITGCALSGPAGCPIPTHPGQTPSEVNDIFQGVLKTAHDTAIVNASALITSGEIRSMLSHPSTLPLPTNTLARLLVQTRPIRQLSS